jgi:hypothetical protein
VSDYVAPMVITEPGPVYGMPEDAYHADPVPEGSLSSSWAKKLLPPSCPEKYRWDADHPEERKTTPAMVFGKAAHRLVLGRGADIAVVDAPDWRTKAARAERDAAEAAGMIPMLPHEHQVAVDMADAITRHPTASALFAPGTGNAEVALFDRRTVVPELGADPVEVWVRCLLDWLPSAGPGRMIVPDYKTAASADPDAISRSFYDRWLPMQAAWNVDLIKSLGLADDPHLVFVFQEKTPPFSVTVSEPDAEAMRIGRIRNAEALRTWAACRQSGRWPGYGDGQVIQSPLPVWIERQYADE